MALRIVTAVVSIAAVSACAGQGAAPVDYRGHGAPAAATQGGARGGPAPIEHRGAAAIEPRQSPPRTAAPVDQPTPTADLWEGPGAPLSAWALQPEDAQPYDPRDPEAAHVVAAGETLYTIASRRQTPLRALIDANGLMPPFRLEAGQVLILPPPATHTVQPGETLSAVGRRYNVDARSLALMNRLRAPYTLRVGDRLVLPAGARAPEPAPSPAPTPAAAAGPRPPGRLAWPVQGALVARFGAAAAGGRAEAVEIAAAPGTPVRAAADGRVLFAGEGPSALGGLVIVDHGQGLVTTVGFLTGVLAQEGARVAQGQVVALASSDRVLFQVRRNGAAEDPADYLSPP